MGSAQQSAESAARALTLSMDREAERLIDDLAASGAQRGVLEAHLAEYRQATTEEERLDAAAKLARVMEDQMVGLEETADHDEVRQRQALQTRVQSVTRHRTRMVEAQEDWRTSASTATGKLAVLLRLAGKPPEPQE